MNIVFLSWQYYDIKPSIIVSFYHFINKRKRVILYVFTLTNTSLNLIQNIWELYLSPFYFVFLKFFRWLKNSTSFSENQFYLGIIRENCDSGILKGFSFEAFLWGYFILDQTIPQEWNT